LSRAKGAQLRKITPDHRALQDVRLHLHEKIVHRGITIYRKRSLHDCERMAPVSPDKPSIAVLPFANMSSDPEQEFFADGMTEDLITDLSRNSGLFVIARNSVFAYKGKSINVRRISEDLGVRYLLEGSARRFAGRVRINVQLIDAANGKPPVGRSLRSNDGRRLCRSGRSDRQNRRGSYRSPDRSDAEQTAREP
jgi:TolB-like protein